jgi:glycosyltransferase involved in cell wall biosynthesis
LTKHYKIAVVAACPFPYPRGTPIRIYRMAEALAARGHAVHVVAYHLGHKMDEVPFAIHRIPDIPTYRKTSPGPSYQKILLVDPLLALKLYQVVRRQGIDVIHAHHYEGLIAGWWVARLTGVPLVFDVHTLLESELPHYELGLPGALLRRIASALDHALPPRADHIITVTNLIRTKLINEIGIAPDQVTTVYTGVEKDLGAMHPLEPASAQHTLIYTGNLAQYQGVDLMLRAFRLVLDRKPDVILKILTESPIETYQPLIDELGLQDNLLVEAADYFELPDALYGARIALNPRLQADGLPVKLLNYMATGRAIVSFKGSAEILTDGETGLIARDDSVESFAEAILRLLDDRALSKRLGEAAQLTVQEFFVWESMVKILEDVYARVLEEKA